jgi:hypothetical protein
LARHVVKNASSLHGYLAKVVMEANKVEQKHMAPKLFYVFRPQDSIDSLVSNQKKHLYSKAIDANSIGMLVRQIWKEEWDREVYLEAAYFTTFDLKFKSPRPQDKVIHFRCFDVVDVPS